MQWLSNFRHICWALIYSRKTTKKFEHDNDKLFIVATGPSAKKFWSDFEFQKQVLAYDICLLNDSFFAYKEQVFKLRPKYFCIMDWGYFGKNVWGDRSSEERLSVINENLKILKEVNWPLTMIIPCGKTLDIVNPNISYIYLNASICDKKIKCKYYLYDKNIMNPCNNTVTHSAIYFGIMSGYKRIGLIGADCNFVKNIEVDPDGQVSMFIPHSFEDQEFMEKFYLNEIQMFQSDEGVVSACLKRESETVGGYMYLRDYADYKKVKIFNYSKGTLIDAFEIVDY